MKELALVTYIKNFGLAQAISEFKLSVKDYGHKVSIKYSQIESPMGREEVQDARGIVLEKGTWKVMSLGFRKFFNSGEGHAHKINWENAMVFKKYDGSLITGYWDQVSGKWCFSTSGTGEGEGKPGEFHHGGWGETFSDLFLYSYEKFSGKKKEFLLENLEKGNTYSFELCTPYNVTVTPHTEFEVYLLGGRDLSTMEEFSRKEMVEWGNKIFIPCAESYPLNSLSGIQETFQNMSFSEEGYVVWDGVGRIKEKNPAYVAAHHLKGSTAAWRVMDIVRSNEIEEYLTYNPNRRDEVLALNDLWVDIKRTLLEAEVELKMTSEYLRYRKDCEVAGMKLGGAARKQMVDPINKIITKYGIGKFSSFLFKLSDGEGSSSEYLMSMDAEKLYNILNKA